MYEKDKQFLNYIESGISAIQSGSATVDVKLNKVKMLKDKLNVVLEDLKPREIHRTRTEERHRIHILSSNERVFFSDEEHLLRSRASDCFKSLSKIKQSLTKKDTTPRTSSISSNESDITGIIRNVDKSPLVVLRNAFRVSKEEQQLDIEQAFMTVKSSTGNEDILAVLHNLAITRTRKKVQFRFLVKYYLAYCCGKALKNEVSLYNNDLISCTKNILNSLVLK